MSRNIKLSVRSGENHQLSPTDILAAAGPTYTQWPALKFGDNFKSRDLRFGIDYEDFLLFGCGAMQSGTYLHSFREILQYESTEQKIPIT
jgi:hypothetical protein